MDIVKAMRTFVAVVEENNFTSAARGLQVSTAYTSRALLELEKRLGVQLIHRSTRSVTVTHSGQAYYKFCIKVLAELQEIEASLAGDQLSKSGIVRVHIDKAIGIGSMLRHLTGLSSTYPDLDLDLAFAGEYRESLRRGFDCAIVTGELESSDFRAGRLGDLENVVVAAPRYMKRAPAVSNPTDLAGMRILDLSSALVGGRVSWTFENSLGRETVRSRCCISVDDTDALHQAALYGAGVARLARGAVSHDIAAGTLQEILPSYRLPSTPMWIVYRYERFQPKRVTIFIEWLRGLFMMPGLASPEPTVFGRPSARPDFAMDQGS